jgi:hypothetical protein
MVPAVVFRGEMFFTLIDSRWFNLSTGTPQVASAGGRCFFCFWSIKTLLFNALLYEGFSLKHP